MRQHSEWSGIRYCALSCDRTPPTNMHSSLIIMLSAMRRYEAPLAESGPDGTTNEGSPLRWLAGPVWLGGQAAL